MNNKVVYFEVDGTLSDSKADIPSTIVLTALSTSSVVDDAGKEISSVKKFSGIVIAVTKEIAEVDISRTRVRVCDSVTFLQIVKRCKLVNDFLRQAASNGTITKTVKVRRRKQEDTSNDKESD